MDQGRCAKQARPGAEGTPPDAHGPRKGLRMRVHCGPNGVEQEPAGLRHAPANDDKVWIKQAHQVRHREAH
jgi:hypothetical protein